MSFFVDLIQVEEKLLVLSFDCFALFLGVVTEKGIKGDFGCHVLIGPLY